MNATDEQRRRLLQSWGLPPDAKLIGAVGPLTINRRIKDLIWATDLVKAIRDDAFLIVFGDGPHRWRLERYRDQVRIRDRVRFVGNRTDLLTLLPHLHVLCQASQVESCPNSVLEAMAARVPVIATDIPGHQNLIRSQQSGILVPVGHRAGFSRYIEKILQDEALATRLANAAHQFVAQHHSIGQVAAQYVEVYRGLQPSLEPVT